MARTIARRGGSKKAVPARATVAAAPARAQSDQSIALFAPIAAAMDTLEDTLGGREAFIRACAGGELSDTDALILGALADPRQGTKKLSTICHARNISLGTLYRLLRQGIYAEALVKSMTTIATHTPGVVGDVMGRAVPHEVACEKCRGGGTVSKDDAPPTMCTGCRGTGKVGVLPELERQKVALSLGPLAPKSPPFMQVSVADNRSVTVMDASPLAYSKLLKMKDQSLYGPRDSVIDAPMETPDADPPAAD